MPSGPDPYRLCVGLEQSMHRALQIPELVELTFAQLISLPVEFHRNDKGTLARAARTCRAWTEIALTRLWGEMNTLAPLFRLLGPLKITKTLQNDDEEPFLYLQEFEFRSPSIKPSAWIRFDHYARYIRTLEFILEIDHAYSPKLYEAIAVHRPHTFGLLPNLRALTYADNTDGNAGITPLITLLTPSIRRFTFGGFAEQHRPAIMTHHLPSRTPFLESLMLHAEVKPENMEPWLGQLHHLKHLEIESKELTQNGCSILGGFAPLESLKISTWFEETFEHVAPLSSGSFGYLRSLELKATISAWTEFLQNGSMPPVLRNLCIDIGKEGQQVPVDGISTLSEAVASAIPGLESFRLHTSRTLEDHHTIVLRDLKPLLGCGNLHTFIAKNGAGVSISTEDVRAMLQAWPRLRCLRIIYSPSGVHFPPSAPAPKTVTLDWPKRTLPLDILALFAEMCPDIEELAIPASDSPLTLLPFDQHPTLRRLRILDIYQTSIQDPQLVALYLSRIIPRTVSLRWDGRAFEEVNPRYRAIWSTPLKRWEEVEALSEILRIRSRIQRELSWSWVRRTTKRRLGAA